MENDQGFWRKVWQEAEPIIAHAVIIILLETSLLIIGLLTLGLEGLFPEQEEYFSLLKKVDIWVALALLCMFGFYTVIRAGIRLIKGIAEEARKGVLPKGRDDNAVLTSEELLGEAQELAKKGDDQT